MEAEAVFLWLRLRFQ